MLRCIDDLLTLFCWLTLPVHGQGTLHVVSTSRHTAVLNFFNALVEPSAWTLRGSGL